MPTVHQAAEMCELRDYVTAGDASRYDNQAAGSLRLDVTHSNLIQRWHDLIFQEDSTVMATKEKLYRHGGTPVSWQELYLRRGGGDTILMLDDSKTLKYYGAKNGMEIHLKDLDPHSISKHGGLEDVSQVEKYVMPDEEYDKLKNTVRSQKKADQARMQAEAAARLAEEGPPEVVDAPTEMSVEEASVAYPVGSRAECDPGSRRGEVCYVGHVDGVKGAWIGVRLDEPQGQNDGTKDGKKYFECPGNSYGCFVKPANIRVGDYPERDPFASDDDEF